MTTTLRVMSWNVEANQNPNDATAAVADTICAEAPDVLGLQEVCRGWLMWELLPALVEGGWAPAEAIRASMYPTVSLAGCRGYRGAPDADYGIAIVARVPISNSRSATLSRFAAREPRSLATVDVEADGGALAHFATTQTAPQAPHVHAKDVARRARHLHGATILAGDFQVYPGEPGHERDLRDLEHRFVAIVAPEPTFFSARGGTPRAIDYLWVTPELNVTDVHVVASTTPHAPAGDGTYASDHRPLVAVVELP